MVISFLTHLVQPDIKRFSVCLVKRKTSLKVSFPIKFALRWKQRFCELVRVLWMCECKNFLFFCVGLM